MISSNNPKQIITILIISLLGSYVAIIQGSNFIDGDSYSLILASLDLIDTGIYNPSRGAYGHPLPELIIGISTYNFGTPVSNLIGLLFFLSSIFILFKTFFEKFKNKLLIFFLLIVSNFSLFFDNLTTSDYPYALFFFSLGLMNLLNKRYSFSILFFILCIGCRANFVLFIYPIIFIYFLNLKNEFNFKKFLIYNLILTIFGLLFYIPVFYTNNFSLDFLQLPFLNNTASDGWYGGPALKLQSLVPRFIYKIYIVVGIYASLLMLFFIPEIYKKIKKNIDLKIQISLLIIILNLFLFFFMPTKTSLLNPFIIFLYIILFKIFDEKKLILIILLNFLQWFVSYEILNIKYKEQKICFAKEAISANFVFRISSGYLIKYFDQNKNLKYCYSQFMGKYKDNFEKGIPLKFSD